MQHQLPLEFKFNNEYTFDSFVTGSNGELIDALQNMHLVDDVPFIYFWGKPGVGKSHLLQALCQSNAFVDKPVAMIPLNESDFYSPEMLDGLEAMSLVCIDNIQSISGNTDWEIALFHFYNRARESSTPLVICGDSPPTQLGLALQDLKTRLGWGLVFQLKEIDDEDKVRAMRHRANIRGIDLSDEVGEYLLRRHSRDVGALISLLDGLDKASLAHQRRLTIPFVKQFLDSID
jgi:DnaA family protein